MRHKRREPAGSLSLLALCQQAFFAFIELYVLPDKFY